MRDKILQKNDHSIEPLAIPEWDCEIYIRSWTGTERNLITKRWQAGDLDKGYGEVVVMSVCDDSGARIFTDADIDQVMSKNAAVLERIVLKALEVNGINKAAVENAKKN